MKVSDLFLEVENIKNPKKLSQQNKKKLRDVLSGMFDTIERVEKDGDIHLKSDTEKIDLLKNIIANMVKDEEQKSIIKGEN